MKTKNNILAIIACLFTAFMMVATGCKKEHKTEPETKPAIIINSIAPAHGPFDTKVMIKGKNFPGKDELQVKFNGTKAEIMSATDTQIMVKVPKKAGTGPVKVLAGDDSAKSIDFQYEYTTVVTTIAGVGKSGFKDGPGAKRSFIIPSALPV